VLDKLGEILGVETYKIVPGRGFVNTRQLKAEAAMREMQAHLRGALREAEKTMANIELFPPETQELMRELQGALHVMTRDAETGKIEDEA
jgi:hypothetical protein